MKNYSFKSIFVFLAVYFQNTELRIRAAASYRIFGYNILDFRVLSLRALASGFLSLALSFLALNPAAATSQLEPTKEPKVNTLLTNLHCSGKISDLDCYRDIIRETVLETEKRPGYQANHRPVRKMFLQGQRILVDTQDAEACSKVESFLKGQDFIQGSASEDFQGLCQSRNESDRYRSVTLMWETDETYFTEINLSGLKDTEQNLVNDTRNLMFGGALTLGALWLAPESFTNFDKKKIQEQNPFENWYDNVRRRPVMDKDGAFLNFVLHPISGAIYYSVARTEGASAFKSLGYSIMMSTFFWEYGLEATVERPSIQDLIATPLLGAVLGELGYHFSQKIEANGGRVLGSYRLGKILMVLLNPGRSISNAFNKIVGKKIIQSAEGNLVVGRKSDPFFVGQKYNYVGLQLGFKFY